MTFLKFPVAPPVLQTIIETAERQGGLQINVVRNEPNSLIVAFDAFPDGQVTISYQDSFTIGLVDYSLKAPTLFRLLSETIKQLGGEGHDIGLASLQLPLTKKVVRNDLRSVYVYSTIGMALLFAVLVAIVGFVLWAMGHSVMVWLKPGMPA